MTPPRPGRDDKAFLGDTPPEAVLDASEIATVVAEMISLDDKIAARQRAKHALCDELRERLKHRGLPPAQAKSVTAQIKARVDAVRREKRTATMGKRPFMDPDDHERAVLYAWRATRTRGHLSIVEGGKP